MSNQTTKRNTRQNINKSAKQIVMQNAQQNALRSSNPNTAHTVQPKAVSTSTQSAKYTSGQNAKTTGKQVKQAAKMTQKQRDDALFEALGKNKKKKKRKILITVVSILLVIAIVLVVGVNALQQQVRNQFASSIGEVKSYTATTGTISTVVSGSGTLTDVDMQSITVPNGVEITDVSVARNDAVEEGDVLATVNLSTVISAMASLQAEIEALDKQLAEAEDDEVNEIITSGVSGRVKVIYASEGTSVVDTMVENGALALISLDGYLAVDIETDAVAAKDSVKVKLSDDTEISGTVESLKAGIATILVTDEGTAFEDSVTVYTTDGTKLGTGKLYIHSSLAITGYAGNVSEIHIAADDQISASTELFTLSDTSFSANYETLLRSRAEKEETLLELLTIQKNGAVLAPFDGSVYSVDYADGGTSVVTLTTDESMSATISIDESDILSLELGQEVDVYVSSIGEDAFTGTLTEINKTSSSSGTYSAVITLDKAENMLSGMTANVSIKIEGVEDAILIPVEALTQTSSTAYVYTSYDEETQSFGGMVEVEVGISNSNYVEIISGLDEGDVVYYTESSSIDSMFGNMFGNMGGMGDFGGFGGDFGDFGGGEFPGGSFPGGGNMPSGGFGGFGG